MIPVLSFFHRSSENGSHTWIGEHDYHAAVGADKARLRPWACHCSRSRWYNYKKGNVKKKKPYSHSLHLCADMWQTIHRATGREVVLKVMPVKDRRARERARREGQVLSSIVHPNVVQCCAIYEVPFVLRFCGHHSLPQGMSEVVLALEYCQGGDMLDRINTRGKYSEKQAKIYFKQIVEALAFCYASGFSHRDVKVCKKKKSSSPLPPVYSSFTTLTILSSIIFSSTSARTGARY